MDASCEIQTVSRSQTKAIKKASVEEGRNIRLSNINPAYDENILPSNFFFYRGRGLKNQKRSNNLPKLENCLEFKSKM